MSTAGFAPGEFRGTIIAFGERPGALGGRHNTGHRVLDPHQLLAIVATLLYRSSTACQLSTIFCHSPSTALRKPWVKSNSSSARSAGKLDDVKYRVDPVHRRVDEPLHDAVIGAHFRLECVGPLLDAADPADDVAVVGQKPPKRLRTGTDAVEKAEHALHRRLLVGDLILVLFLADRLDADEVQGIQ